jgi:hypothetical protein
MAACLRLIAGLNIKRFTTPNRFFKGSFKIFTFLAPYVDMVVRPEETGFQLAVRCYPEPVAVPAEFGVVKRADHFHLGTIETVFLPVVHSSRYDYPGPVFKI